MSSTGTPMPQIFKVSRPAFAVDCQFLGFRRCKILRWIPYVTGSEPRINLKVATIDKEYPTSSCALAIEHIRPDDTVSIDWNATTSEPVYQEQVSLKQLTEAGHHNYDLQIRLDGYDYRERVFATGKVFWWDEMVRAFLLFIAGLIGGSLLTLLIQGIID